MKVREVMSCDIDAIRSSLSAKAAADRMVRNGIGYLPVKDGKRLVGVVTDRDITCRVVAGDRCPRATKVADIVSKAVAYCFDDDEVRNAVHLMEQNRIRPVPNRKQRLVGILSASDMAAHAPHYLTAEIIEAPTRETPLSVTVDPLAEVLR